MNLLYWWGRPTRSRDIQVVSCFLNLTFRSSLPVRLYTNENLEHNGNHCLDARTHSWWWTFLIELRVLDTLPHYFEKADTVCHERGSCLLYTSSRRGCNCSHTFSSTMNHYHRVNEELAGWELINSLLEHTPLCPVVGQLNRLFVRLARFECKTGTKW